MKFIVAAYCIGNKFISPSVRVDKSPAFISEKPRFGSAKIVHCRLKLPKPEIQGYIRREISQRELISRFDCE